jgi:hypothetical protein
MDVGDGAVSGSCRQERLPRALPLRLLGSTRPLDGTYQIPPITKVAS